MKKHFLAIALLFFFSACGAGQRMESPEKSAVQNEIMVGRALAAKLIKKYGLIKNESATVYLNLLGQSLAASSARPELLFHFGILNTDEVNAFSCPGGYILITRGALEHMTNEAELAYVLAHEISHVSLSHSGDFRSEKGIIDFIAVFIGAGGHVVNGAVRTATALLEKQILENGRQKEFEFEADRAALLLTAPLGYDPGAALTYLGRIAGAEKNEILVKTHPAFSERIAGLQIFITEQGLGENAKSKRKQRFENFIKLLKGNGT